MKQATIIKSTGSWYLLKDKITSTIYEARIRGKFKKEKISTTNPLAVGDEVDYELHEDGVAWITTIHPRKNYIIRKSVNLSKSTHILASNIDLACIIFTIKNPQTSLGFLNRLLITCEAYHIPVLIVINKIDLLINEEDLKEIKEVTHIYKKIGYDILEISANKNINIDILKYLLKNKVSLFLGHSGSGKSSTINALQPDLDLKTSVISNSNDKGKHTTTFAQMYDWSFGGSIIDIPGIKEFELVEISKEELQNFFPEIYKFRSWCKFHNCLHLNEPNCAVIKAVDEDEISQRRYSNYLKILKDL
ncbi:ribosome small subunit-dependent GTPase A [Apibacter muscae]|uniref:Small ribosomal subunit biogenesis GTPase RsgA n=1 Tax=Apibacter muscae TaxID=2509004 RepID=A0A563D9M1_9FLAO|nr:ribosome small subunit-dependent GTPase A [Apibacter muscae]TWP26643.1 ribosome small subunit-dependent GTPase A [Apibacter muscae]TWP28217.1 ribosome small subunit-dependent GTPase A [Apibacter muscae]